MLSRVAKKEQAMEEIAAAKNAVDKLTIELEEAENKVTTIKKSLEAAEVNLKAKRNARQKEIDDLWNDLNAHSKNLIQQAYWKSKTDYPELISILEKVYFKDNAGVFNLNGGETLHALSYYKAFNPYSPNSGLYINKIDDPTILVRGNQLLEKFEECIVGDGILIDISRMEDADIASTMQRFLPVVFFFKNEKKLEGESLIMEVKSFFENKADTRNCPEELYELL